MKWNIKAEPCSIVILTIVRPGTPGAGDGVIAGVFLRKLRRSRLEFIHLGKAGKKRFIRAQTMFLAKLLFHSHKDLTGAEK